VTLVGAALLALQVGVADAQNTTDKAPRLPANKGTAQNAPTEAAQQPSPKMSEQSPANTQSPQSQEKQVTSQASQNQASGQGQGDMAKQSTSSKAGTSGEKAASNAASSKKARSAAKSTTQDNQQAGLSPDEHAYRDALKQCAMESETSRRDTCLDGAINRFGKSS